VERVHVYPLSKAPPIPFHRFRQVTKMNKTDVLPWVSNPMLRTFTLDASSLAEPNLFVIRKIKEGKQIGQYAGFHNSVRISAQAHEHAGDAKAETEAYFYSLPQFRNSGQAAAMNAMREIGAADFGSRMSVVDGIKKYDGAARENWLTGWLTAYSAEAVQMQTRRVVTLTLVLQFAMFLETDAANFLRDFLNDPTKLPERWPNWFEFIQANGMKQPETATNVEP
jgi:hypothetical protein